MYRNIPLQTNLHNDRQSVQNDVKENLFLQLGTTILTSQKIIEYFLKQKHGNLILFSSHLILLIIYIKMKIYSKRLMW